MPQLVLDPDQTASASIARSVPTTRPNRSAAPEALSFAKLRELKPPEGWTRPVCLLVDEIQQAEGGILPVLNKLHQGRHRLPLVPVLAGLGSSRDHLHDNIGLTRLTRRSVHDIGCLAPEEAREAVERMLDEYRVVRDGRDWAGWLAEVSDCWPQHLFNGMSALADGLAAAGGRLADVDVDAVTALEAAYREEDYRDRVSPEMEASAGLVAAVMAALPEGGDGRIALAGTVERLAKDEHGWRLPEGKTPAGFLDLLIHQGALQATPRPGRPRMYDCPIPSLRSYLVGYGTAQTPGVPAPDDMDTDLLGPA